MAHAHETSDSGSGTKDSREFACIIHDAADDIAALLALNLIAPMTWGKLKRDDYRLEPLGGGSWNGYMSYSPRGRNEQGASSYSFDTTGGTQHITVALKHIGDYGDQSLNFEGLINVNPDGIAEGVDVVVPQFRWQETHNVNVDLLTEAYAIALMKITGCVNTDVFRGLAAGEVMFLGATGSTEGEDTAPITYHFHAEPNAVNIRIGDHIVVPEKKGHEYMWMSYETKQKANPSRTGKRGRALLCSWPVRVH